MKRILLWLLLSYPLLGVQAWVQSGPTTCHAASGNIACAITGLSAGNILTIGLAYRINTTTGPTSVVSTLGNTTAAVSNSLDSQTGAWLYCMAITTGGSETITVTMNGTYFFGHVVLQEFSGSTCTTSGTSANSSLSSVNVACGSFTPSTANNIILATAYDNTTTSDLTAATGYTTNALLVNTGGPFRSAGMEFKVVTSAVLEAPTFLQPTGSANSCAAAAFKASGVASTPIRHRVTQ